MIDWTNVDKAFRSVAAPCVDASHSKHASKEDLHVFPGAVLLVGHRGRVLYERAVGCRSLVPEVTPMQVDTVFDVSSLTKAIVTTTLIMQLVEKKQIEVDQPLSRILQTFGTSGKTKMTIRHLLTHTSGYPAYIPFYKQIAELDSGPRAGIMTSRAAVEFVYNEIFRSSLINQPGKSSAYSDVGFILLGNVIDVVCGGKRIDKLAQERIFGPLSMRSTGYIDLSKFKRRGLAPVTDVIAPTVDCKWRERIICGEVHDENAWAMGGVAGHAGLFSTARDIHNFAIGMIRCWHGFGKLVGRDTIRSFWTRDNTVEGSSWALGWDTPSSEGSSAGKLFSRNGVGHLGFTGCSLWIDPKEDIDIVLLSNRIHPSVKNKRIKDFRPVIHDLVMEALAK